jgi:hypothetical protein
LQLPGEAFIEFVGRSGRSRTESGSIHPLFKGVRTTTPASQYPDAACRELHMPAYPFDMDLIGAVAVVTMPNGFAQLVEQSNWSGLRGSPLGKTFDVHTGAGRHTRKPEAWKINQLFVDYPRLSGAD